jgi:hypothetical protein
VLVLSVVIVACGNGDEKVVPASTSVGFTASSTTTTPVVAGAGDREVCQTAQVFANTASDQNAEEAIAELARVAPRASNERLRAAASELGAAGAGWGLGHDAAIEAVSTECNDLGIYVQFP